MHFSSVGLSVVGGEGERERGAQPEPSPSGWHLEIWGTLGSVDTKNFMVIVEDKEEGWPSLPWLSSHEKSRGLAPVMTQTVKLK